MNAHFTYLLIDFGCLLIPLIASFYPPHPFYKQWKPFLIANIFVAVPFIIWDVIFTHLGVWGFNPQYLIGITLFNLPIEEILFFIFIPYCCSFTYFALKYLLPEINNNSFDRLMKGVFLVISLFYALQFDQLYTQITGILTSVFIIITIFKKIDLTYIFIAYFAIIPFFLLSNGLLTGSWLENPVVWYNNEENFGIRAWTIPIEDFIYGFLLVCLNMLIMRYLMTRYTNRQTQTI